MGEEKQNRNRFLIGAAFLIIITLILLSFVYFFRREVTNENEKVSPQKEADFVTKPTQLIKNYEKDFDLPLYEIKAANQEFDPKEIVVKLGAPVSFVLHAVDADYDFELSYSDELPILRAKKGQISDSLIFTPEKTGEFPFSCPSCPRTSGGKIKGVLIVKVAPSNNNLESDLKNKD